MVKLLSQPDPDAMDRTFAALADPTRRAILARLAADARASEANGASANASGNSGDETSEGAGGNSGGGGGGGIRVTELAAPFIGDLPGSMSLPAVSKHLRVLERAGLLKQEKDGRIRRCHLQAEPLQQAHEWVAFYRQFWTQKLDALADYLEDESRPAPPTQEL